MKYEVELSDEQARTIAAARPEEDRERFDSPWFTGIFALADAIRANPPKPPRMDEPRWGEKVIAHTTWKPERRQFIRWSLGSINAHDWASDTGTVVWADLIDPEPVTS